MEQLEQPETAAMKTSVAYNRKPVAHDAPELSAAICVAKTVSCNLKTDIQPLSLSLAHIDCYALLANDLQLNALWQGGRLVSVASLRFFSGKNKRRPAVKDVGVYVCVSGFPCF